MHGFDTLISRLLDRSRRQGRTILAVAGPPGAGKSTAASAICSALNLKGARSRVVPMDGFHFDNRILEPAGLLARKGAPETFDAAGFVAQIKRLSERAEDVAIPVFDRQRDIAIAGAEQVPVKDDILIVEGNYLLLKEAPWSRLRAFWSESIFINPGMHVLEARLVQRWLNHGLSEAEARTRATENDIPNARIVVLQSTEPTLQMTPDAFDQIHSCR
ncbi:MAG: nucleoside/nucleotide kinase family protein [Pseudomonadota bacterium]